LLSGVDKEIHKVRSSLASNDADTGSGDVYSHALDYSPGGIIGSTISRLTSTVSNVTDHLTPNVHLGSAVQSFLGLKTIKDFLLATRDRRIPDASADVTSLDIMEAKVGGKTITDKAGLSRYDSLYRLLLVSPRNLLRGVGSKYLNNRVMTRPNETRPQR